ncbi:MAG TPA: hypothetical protein VHD14_12290 [Pseudolabrys sp.]|nr:hypothetical protein [Pseudolabrys sp.]
MVRGAISILTAASALLLGACVARDPAVSSVNAVPAGNWKIERQVDRITGAPLSSAFLTTRNVSNSTVVFPQPAMLQLLCFKSQPTVRIAFPFKIGSVHNTELGYRFDDKPGHQAVGRFLANYTSVIIDDKAEVAQFVGELATSNTLYVRIRSLTAGRSTAEFRLDGAPAAIGAAYAGCPVQSAQPAKPAAKKHASAN